MPSGSAPNRVAFATQPVVQLQDAKGKVVAQSGVVVTVSTSSGGGTLGGTTTATTASTGAAVFTDLSIAGTIGDRTLTFSSPGLTSATATVALTAGAAEAIAVSSGDAQFAPVGTAVATAPSVKVTDADDNAVAGVEVVFAVVSGGGSITGATQTTNASGIATIGGWTLGPKIVRNTLTATTMGLLGSPVLFTAEAHANVTLPLVDRIVFETTRTDTLGDVATVKLDGTDFQVLTDRGTRDFCPALSPDGKVIAYYSSPTDFVPVELTFMRADGSAKLAARTLPYGSLCPQWSANSQVVVVFQSHRVSTVGRTLSVVHVHNAAGTPITSFVSPEIDYLAVSPDGGRLAFGSFERESGRGAQCCFFVGTMRIDGSDQRAPLARGRGPVWSPSGSQIVYGCAGLCGCIGLCIMNADGSGVAQLSESGGGAAFSHDGTRIAFTCTRDLCFVRPNGEDLGRVVLGTVSGVRAWSPRDDLIAFDCLLDQQEICLFDVATGSSRNLTNDPGIDKTPSFSPQSRP